MACVFFDWISNFNPTIDLRSHHEPDDEDFETGAAERLTKDTNDGYA
jgi:hypothetical protein